MSPVFYPHAAVKLGTDVRLAVIFRTLPNDQDHCLTVQMSRIPTHVESNFRNLIESDEARNEKNLADLLSRRTNPESGHDWLSWLHYNQLLTRLPTKEVRMTPTPTHSIMLDELLIQLGEVKPNEPAPVVDLTPTPAADPFAAYRGIEQHMTKPVNESVESAAPAPAASNADLPVWMQTPAAQQLIAQKQAEAAAIAGATSEPEAVAAAAATIPATDANSASEDDALFFLQKAHKAELEAIKNRQRAKMIAPHLFSDEPTSGEKADVVEETKAAAPTKAAPPRKPAAKKAAPVKAASPATGNKPRGRPKKAASAE